MPRTHPATRDEVIQLLLAHRTLGDAPREELEWLADHGELRDYEIGDVFIQPDALPTEMIIVFAGDGAVYVERGGEKKKFLEWRAGDVTGMLPYSRMKKAPGVSKTEHPLLGLVINVSCFRELTVQCPVVTERLVHIMIDRARQFSATDWQLDKLASLGRLSAGLAHELNNPASAVARAARTLVDKLAKAEAAARELGALNLGEREITLIDNMREGNAFPRMTGVFSAIERADREEEVGEWLDAHGADPDTAQSLSENGVPVFALDDLARAVPDEALDTALRSVAAGVTTRLLADYLAEATGHHAAIETVREHLHRLGYVCKRPTWSLKRKASDQAGWVKNA